MSAIRSRGRLRSALAACLLLIAPGTALAQPQRLWPLWHSARGSIEVTPCPPGDDTDEYCRAVVATSGSRLTPLGSGYERVTLLWSRRHGERGPDALVLGDYGGSGGNADLFAVRFGPQFTVRKLGGERFDTVTARTVRSRVRIELPFDVEYFNGAPHAGAIVLPLPAIWTGNDVAVDLHDLTAQSYSPSNLRFRALAIREELHAWAADKFPATRLYPPTARQGTPVAATAIIEMMLSGHADQARRLLDAAWPRQWEHGDRPLGGEEDFWRALCRAVVAKPSWQRFGLARLPHADIIESNVGRPRR